MDDEDQVVAEGMEAEGPPDDDAESYFADMGFREDDPWETEAEEDGMRRLQEAGLSWC